MKKTLFAFLALTFTGIATAQANLMLNPDFESPGGNFQLGSDTIDHWTTTGSEGWYQADLSLQTIKIWGNQSTEASQNFSCTAGTEYQLGIDYYSRAGEAEWMIDRQGVLKAEWFSDLNGTLKISEIAITLQPASADTWYATSMTSTAPISAVTGRFSLTTQDTGGAAIGTCYFNNASVAAIPEPISATLFTAGIILATMVRMLLKNRSIS